MKDRLMENTLHEPPYLGNTSLLLLKTHVNYNVHNNKKTHPDTLEHLRTSHLHYDIQCVYYNTTK